MYAPRSPPPRMVPSKFSVEKGRDYYQLVREGRHPRPPREDIALDNSFERRQQIEEEHQRHLLRHLKRRSKGARRSSLLGREGEGEEVVVQLREEEENQP